MHCLVKVSAPPGNSGAWSQSPTASPIPAQSRCAPSACTLRAPALRTPATAALLLTFWLLLDTQAVPRQSPRYWLCRAPVTHGAETCLYQSSVPLSGVLPAPAPSAHSALCQ